MKMRDRPFHGASGYSGLKAHKLTFKTWVSSILLQDALNFYFFVWMNFDWVLFSHVNPLQSREESHETYVK